MREHKFRHNFHDTLNHSCYCSLEPETTSHYILCEQNFSSARLALMNDHKGALSGLRQFLETESSLKIDERGFLFHLKSSFRSQDI